MNGWDLVSKSQKNEVTIELGSKFIKTSKMIQLLLMIDSYTIILNNFLLLKLVYLLLRLRDY